MNERLLKDDVLLPEQFIEHAKSYIDEMMKFQREKIVILEDSVIPSIILLKYQVYQKLLEHQKEPEEKPHVHIGSKEKGMLLAVRNKIHFFYELEDEEILAVTKTAEFVRAKKGDVIFNQGELGNEIYFVVSGSVDISGMGLDKDDFTHITNLGEGSVFGEIGPIIGEVRTARAVVAEDNTLLLSMTLIDVPDEKSAPAFIKINRNFVRALSRKLIQTNEMLYNLQ